MEKRFTIRVKTFEDRVLVFKGVESYEIMDHLLLFNDPLTGFAKGFPSRNCEIQEMPEELY